MQAIILKNNNTFIQYPYAQYVYDLIVQDFIARGGEIRYLNSEQELGTQEQKDVLYVVEVPNLNKIALNWWYRQKWPKLVKKAAASWVLYLDLTLRTIKSTDVQQWLLLCDVKFKIDKCRSPREKSALEQLIRKNLQNADKAFASSKSLAVSVRDLFHGIDEGKIEQLIPYPDAHFHPIDDQDAEKGKQKFGEGEEFYLLDVTNSKEADIIQYLKAFSNFKKWQKTSMKLLLIVTEDLEKDAHFKETLSTYYFRKDVQLCTNLNKQEYAQLLSCAYGLLILWNQDEQLVSVLEAAQSGTLVLTRKTPSIKEYLETSIFELPGNSIEEIGKVMVSAYKSENLRSKYINNGQLAAETFQFQTTKQRLIALCGRLD